MTFCTYLTVYTGSDMPPFYVGSTSVRNIEDGYHGSVRGKAFRDLWESNLRDNPGRFKTVVLTTHDTREEALEKEEQIQRALDVVRSPFFINSSYARCGFVNMGHSPETRRKLSEVARANPNHRFIMAGGASRRGKTHSPATIQLMSEVHKERLAKNPMTAEHRAKSGSAFRGRKHTEETKAKMRAAHAARNARIQS